MFGKQETFRKAALERLASPERLDEMMRLSQPRRWVAWSTLVIMVVLALLWAFWFGEMVERVTGQGILLPGGAMRTVEATSEGKVEKILVKIGDVVSEKSPLVRMSQKVGEFDLDQLQKKLNDLELKNTRLAADEERDLASQTSKISAQTAQAVRERNANLASFNEKNAAYLSAMNSLTKGDNEKRSLYAAAIAAHTAIQKYDSEIKRYESELLELQNRIKRQRDDRQLEMAEVKREIAKQEVRNDSDSTIRVPLSYSGRVADVLVREGGTVSPKDPVVRLEQIDKPLKALAFVPMKQGEGVRHKMVAQISPSTVKREEYGAMLGIVDAVIHQPQTKQGMVNDLGNETQVDEYLKKLGTPYRVEASLKDQPGSASGFEWTSARGPNTPITSGTPCELTVIVERKKPYLYLLARVKETLGLN